MTEKSEKSKRKGVSRGAGGSVRRNQATLSAQGIPDPSSVGVFSAEVGKALISLCTKVNSMLAM